VTLEEHLTRIITPMMDLGAAPKEATPLHQDH